VLAIPMFLLAAVATAALAVIVESRGRSALTWSLGLECAALTAFLIAAFAGAPLSDPNAATVVAASLLGLFAMGTQSATVRLLMRNVASTNVMTTNTTQIAIDATELFLAWLARRTTMMPPRRTHSNDRARFARLFSIMLGFLLGTAAGTLAYVAMGLFGLSLPLAIMYGIFAWASAFPRAG
jgi:uncharacterized membrane protein YoaK (UPF0700 family)